MADLLIRRTIKIGGVLTDADSPPVLRDPTAAFGMRRADTLAIVVAAGTALTKVATGVYERTVTDLVVGVTYTYWIETAIKGQPTRVEKSYTPAAATTLPSMLTVERAKALIADLPDVPKAAALSDANLAKRLAICSRRVNTAHRWQGRKYDRTQTWEFPRVLHGTWDQLGEFAGVVDYDDVADWDYATSAAIIPLDVELAVIYEIESHEDGSMARVLGKIASGISAQSTGGLSVTYNTAMFAGGRPRLSPRAEQLVSRFILTSGGLL